MAAFSTEQIRNVALLGHGGSGKTALADAMFLASGQTNRLGSVNDATSNSDFEPEEHHRKSSVHLAILPCPWQGTKVNVIDTPGYAEFAGEMLSGLRAADAAVIVVSAPAGIEVGAAQAWQRCEEQGIPRLIVVSKLDWDNTSFDSVAEQISEAWGRKCVPIHVPEGAAHSLSAVRNVLEDESLRTAEGAEAWERLVEAVAEADDEIADKYLEGVELSPEDLAEGLRKGVAAGDIVPVIAASGTGQVGVEQLLTAIVDLLPSPATASRLNESESIPAGASANLVFKTSADSFVGHLSYFRVYGTPVRTDSQLWNVSRNEPEKVSHIYAPKGKEHEPVTEVPTGDIGILSKLTVTRTGDTLSDKSDPVELPGINMPSPSYALAVAPQTKSDLDKMVEAMARLQEEDPSLEIVRDPETHETVIRGLGDVHVETAVARVQRKFGISLETSIPKIAYRETISGTSRSEYRHKKQTGGHGQYGHVVIELRPLERGEGFSFDSKVVGGSVPKEYIPAVEKGIAKSMESGPLGGFPVVDVGVTLVDGSSHSVDSSGMAFELAAGHALRQGMEDAHAVLLEPVMNVRVMSPDDLAGDVIGDLNGRRAHIGGMTPASVGYTVIEAAVPQEAMQRYATDLRSITHGRASFEAEFSHYDVVPEHAMSKIVGDQLVAAGG